MSPLRGAQYTLIYEFTLDMLYKTNSIRCPYTTLRLAVCWRGVSDAAVSRAHLNTITSQKEAASRSVITGYFTLQRSIRINSHRVSMEVSH